MTRFQGVEKGGWVDDFRSACKKKFIADLDSSSSVLIKLYGYKIKTNKHSLSPPYMLM